MGTIQHHSIVVTTFDIEKLRKARKEAVRIFSRRYVSTIQETITNQYITFFIGPDGSKEGWAESGKGDERRAEFFAYLKAFDYEDSANPFDAVEVSYGELGCHIESKIGEPV